MPGERKEFYSRNQLAEKTVQSLSTVLSLSLSLLPPENTEYESGLL